MFCFVHLVSVLLFSTTANNANDDAANIDRASLYVQ